MSSNRSTDDFEADRAFENEVLRVARLIYPGADGGPTIIAGRERDGVLIGNEVAIAIEATRSRAMAKAESDSKKLRQLTEQLARTHPTKAVRGFFVTEEEPTAAQRDSVKKHGGSLVTSISYASLRKQLFDAEAYMAARANYPFGSARDPVSDSFRVTAPYIALDMLEAGTSTTWPLEAVISALNAGTRIVITGEFGVGKSMTLREIYHRVRASSDPTVSRPPIHLNLRNHQGQDDPAEALRRHADRIGFAEPAHLVRAWRAGEVTVLLDGFDEITFPGWTGRVSGLRDVRRRNVALVRGFVAETPPGTGLIVAGRSHFFDSPQEMLSALGMSRYVHLSASDFTDKQVKEFLAAHNLSGRLPAWLPSRPLLLGYLAANGFLDSENLQDSTDAASGWSLLLDMICDREAQIEVGLDGPLVRRIIERLATRARRTSSGRGPLRFDDLNTTFREICGYQPDEGSRVVLDRLPALGIGSDPGANSTDLPREFIDSEIVDAARAGDVYHFITSPSVPGVAGYDFRDWEYLLEDVGLEVVRHRVEAAGLNAKSVAAALKLSVGMADQSGLSCDLLRVALAMGAEVSHPAPDITDFVIPSIIVASMSDAGSATLRNCLVGRLELEDGYTEGSLPRLVGCHIDTVEGAAGFDDLPPGRLVEVEVTTFADSAATTASILDLNLPRPVKVRLSILKKIYLQRGSGRKESALVRGLPPADRTLVPDALAALQAQGLVIRGRAGRATLWLPVRSAQKRALQVLAAPLSSNDPVVTK